jgi:hypothetical protein
MCLPLLNSVDTEVLALPFVSPISNFISCPLAKLIC